MIARNERMQISTITKRVRDQQKHQMAQAAHNAQFTLNAIFWQVIKNMSKNSIGEDEEFDESLNATLTMPCEDLKKIPANFGLTLKQNEDGKTLSVIAILTKPKSNIILPGSG